MNDADATAGLSPPPDPPQDRAKKPVPQNIADVLTLLHILLAYGRHPIATLEHRATAAPAHPPTLEQLEAEIRRRPIGRTIADICRDLGVAPSLCEGSFWNVLFDAIMWYRGNLPKLVLDFRRRQVAFEPELDSDPNLGLPERT